VSVFGWLFTLIAHQKLLSKFKRGRVHSLGGDVCVYCRGALITNQMHNQMFRKWVTFWLVFSAVLLLQTWFNSMVDYLIKGPTIEKKKKHIYGCEAVLSLPLFYITFRFLSFIVVWLQYT